MPWSGAETAPAACPTAAVLRPLSRTVVFNSPGMAVTPTDVMFYGILSEVDVKCETSGDALHASLDVIIAAERGPSTRGNSVDFTYFVAVLGPGDTILSKKSFGIRVGVDQNEKRGGVTDHFDELIPLRGIPAASLRIVAGFQQSPQIIEFYRHYSGH